MAIVKPFQCVRPDEASAHLVAALPYDVYNRKEACEITAANPKSFLNIDRPETQFSDDVDTYDSRVYEKARELLNAWVSDGTLLKDNREAYYIYELVMNGRSQTGIVACSSIDDYAQGIIKKHENTREEKELDRICHVDRTDAQTGPIFLAYRSKKAINEIVERVTATKPLYDFTAEDGVSHKIWQVSDAETVSEIEQAFQGVPSTYIADGHHRAASAVKVGLKRRDENPGYTGEEPFNFFLSVLFPDEQLMIMPYNRVVKDLNGLSEEGYLKQVEEAFVVEAVGDDAYSPDTKGSFGMYLNKKWYRLTIKDSFISKDPVKGLDVSLLQDHLLNPVLGVKDPRIDKRIDFIGGIRGLKELEKRCGEDMTVAFSMYPTSIEELFQVADAGLLMPPKSTWFEPKLRSGLFIHPLTAF
ncbi:DUF1015 domain-containing protein [Lacrimispora xylanolytica]|uniref:DUF1015 family protein n=1 Tax=Lacrimispora xylanolytica TaxID=29375 RepID=A0ABY7AA02_9FIRM|nr:DUF1015 family protein [Lacrimispora xylanolytica]WAJ23386.1 DUF1015 family protein [Lacrimispora xylanolytica]